jgi:scyllo-inositol 2-dehydrogenase (NADP+)
MSFGMSGRIFHAPFLHDHPGFTFSAVTERHDKKVNQSYPVVRSYASVDALIQDPSLELIVVNTPNNTHFDYARQSLLAGKNVLIEKPFATSVAEAGELFGLAKELGLEVMAYQNRRWDSDFQSVKYVLDNGKLGKLVEAHFRFDRYKINIEQKAFKEEPIPGSGLAYNLAPHVLDQVISLFGKPLQCHKTTTRNRPHSKVDDYAFFHLAYPDDVNVYVHVSLLVARPLPAYVLHGTKGSYIKDRTDMQEKQLDQGMSPLDQDYGLELPGGEGELTLADKSGKKITEHVASLRGNYAGLYDAVYRQLRNGEAYPVTQEHVLWQMEILGSESSVVRRDDEF